MLEGPLAPSGFNSLEKKRIGALNTREIAAAISDFQLVLPRWRVTEAGITEFY